MIVRNKTKNTILAKNLKVAKSPIDKFLGLLKKSNPESLLFNTRFGIHTLFLKKPLDIIILNSQDVVEKTATVFPNKFFLYNPKNYKVLELPQGTIKRTKTKIGDRLSFSDNIYP